MESMQKNKKDYREICRFLGFGFDVGLQFEKRIGNSD
jgi:hypothetical protein